MKLRQFIFLCFLLVTGFIPAQDDLSRADILFLEYKYDLAVREYLKEMRENPLSVEQYLNLAESYLKLENYDLASNVYNQVLEKDYELPAYHLNKMLVAWKMNQENGSVRKFMEDHPDQFVPELRENAQFNFDLQETDGDKQLSANIFNLNDNSPNSDFAPSFYRDQLLFTSARTSNDSGKRGSSQPSPYLNIFVARLDPSGNILASRTFENIPKFEFHQGTPFFSEALEAVFYIRSNEANGNLVFDDNGKNALALGSADRNGNFRFLLKDLSTSFYYPFYEAETGKLYFAANFKDGFGGTDLYYVYTNNGLIMSSPINLGPRINTPGNEIAPYIFEGSLYFASDVFYGLGGMDTYKSDILEENTYSIPINLGRGLNSEKDDFGFIIKNYRENSLIGYFGSNRPGGKGSDDLYGFIIEDKPGIKTFTLNGSVVNLQTNERIPEAEIRLLDKAGKVIKEVKTDNKGMFRIEIPWQDAITVEATKNRHSRFSDKFEGEGMEAIQNAPFSMGIVSIDDLVEKTEDQTVLKLNKFYFDKGKSVITPEIAVELEKAVDAVAKFPQLQLRIESHTDSRGGAATNFRISQSRADAIKDYLESHGVSSSNILYSIGYGEDKLLNDCTDGVFCLDTFHKKNERQLIVVLNYDLLF
ncbi:Outer membrane protein OmpA [Muriicola jejuensis]|uniref:OmpA family protein n=1 Tax=Muriicola jejuensis TaxID=504488 RepID=A0A6P0UCU7_9FLAO|nr:OmpA family protein [Muriicola jejuensis]NER09468.1 OmpA family protein [Muriicola jejuensis]SMP08380.1 Outer membrane protein OmpA [Muriicola jejuensis]